MRVMRPAIWRRRWAMALWVRLRPAAAAVRVHLPAVAVRWRRRAGGRRPDRLDRPGLFAEVPLGAAARPGCRRWRRCVGSGGGAAGCCWCSRRWRWPRFCWRCPIRRPRRWRPSRRRRCVAVLSATQDIAIDAWRIEIFPPRRQGAALAAYVWGYRVALLVSTSGCDRGVRRRSAGMAALLGVAGADRVPAPW